MKEREREQAEAEKAFRFRADKWMGRQGLRLGEKWPGPHTRHAHRWLHLATLPQSPPVSLWQGGLRSTPP